MSATRRGEQAGMPYLRRGRINAPYNGTEADFERSWQLQVNIKVSRLVLNAASVN